MDRILLLRDIRHKSIILDDKGSGDTMIMAYSFGRNMGVHTSGETVGG